MAQPEDGRAHAYVGQAALAMEGSSRWLGDAAMKRIIELGAVRMSAVIQTVCATVDFEVLSLPGGSLIALLLWFYAMGARGLGFFGRRSRSLLPFSC
jgi:hypothetical protein